MAIGDRIRIARKQAGFTQKELAQKVAKSSQVISNWERGYTTGINQDDINRLAIALNKPVNYLLGVDNQQDNRPDLPSITPRDEKEIASDLEKMLSELSASTAMGGEMDPDNAENMELLKNALGQAMTLAKRVAKQKFTPKKYRKTTENSLQNYGNDK